ncbi:MAG: hypothetical protein QUV05_08860 [Phycisphaerae bacterium]|nr:hypothetical protein [Phycisphaerae bacterium]
MKNLLVGLSMALLLTGPAWGALTATATLLGPASVDPGQVFEIQMDLQGNEPMTAWTIYINATAGPTPTGTYSFKAVSDWDAAGGVAGNMGAFPVGPIFTVPVVGKDTGGNGIVFSMGVTAPDAPNTTFDMWVTGVIGDLDYSDIEVTPVAPLSIFVTPEPVSALLLLAGLPMLRRRR